MFPNMLTPSQLYQTYLRSAAAHLEAQGSNPAASTSFLVENLLRERNQSLFARHFPLGHGLPAGMPSLPGQMGDNSVSTSSHSSVLSSPPFLKFGVSAILGSEENSSKLGKFC